VGVQFGGGCHHSRELGEGVQEEREVKGGTVADLQSEGGCVLAREHKTRCREMGTGKGQDRPGSDSGEKKDILGEQRTSGKLLR